MNAIWIKTKCPSCGELLNVGKRSIVGQLIQCVICNAELEVISLDPPVVDWPFSARFDNTYIDEEELGYRSRM